MPDMEESADVLIAGGGLVGMTMALALASIGQRSLVIDQADAAAVTDDRYDGRASAITASSCRLLQAIGVWPRLEAHAQPINRVLVSDGRPGSAPSPLTLHFGPAPQNEALGHMIENRHIRRALYETAGETPAIAFFKGRIADFSDGSIRLADGGSLSAALVVSAEGKASVIREAAHIKSIGWTYRQAAIVTTVAHELPHEGVAHELFLPSGPFAILPMTGNRASIVWTETKPIAAAVMAMSDQDFADELRRRFGSHWGHAEPIGPRWTYPLSLHLARRYVAPGLCLIGDAAHGIHPITGQGLNLGLRDVAALTEVISDATRIGLDIGSLPVLERYERWRRPDNVALAVMTDGLNRLFSSDFAPLRFMRDLGMAAVGQIGPLRRVLTRHFMGDLGLKPKLLDGIRLDS